jgi:signal transduction histidine kinase
VAGVRRTERWIALVRVIAVPFAVFQVAFDNNFPEGYAVWAWLTVAGLALAAALLWWATGKELSERTQRLLAAVGLAADTAVASSFVLLNHYEPGTPVRQLLFLPVVEGAVLFAMPGALTVAAATAPVAAAFEWLRADRANDHFNADFVTFQLGVAALMALIVGWLVGRLRTETATAQARATEAEELRDELGRRVDLLDAANRCARALSSSLDVEQAFGAFIRELRALLPFDRVAIVLADEGFARVLATAGEGAETVFPPGTTRPLAGSVLEQVATSGQTVYRRDMEPAQHPEEREFLELGLRSRLAAPLLVGTRAIGMISLVRREPDAFRADEFELVSLLGRLVATAAQNIRAYDAERRTVDELRRLSSLRADFVSLVSHELRSPMAAVIGAARTLQMRWRELSPDQRGSFLALIADETSRLATLISDVLDTSRIETGTFSYTFSDVDVEELVRETVAAASLGQDEVRVKADVHPPLPAIRGDRERLRQVLANLIENAVKWSPEGTEVCVTASADGGVRIDVKDEGPGIPPEHHTLIFEKFGRANVGGVAKPGTGLGLFIARSIAEAHGGKLHVRSQTGAGATFTLQLPVSES